MSGLHPPRVLVVDDDPHVREVLGGVLEQAGLRVTLAGGVREGLSALQSQRPELVLTDLAMPDGTGHEVLQAANDLADPPPVIVVSGSISGRDGATQELLEAGARHILPKPFALAELLTIVQSAVGI